MKKLICVVCVFIMCFCLFPLNVLADDKEVSLLANAVSGVLINPENGEVIFSKDMNKKVAVASMTKMVAQIIILEKIESGKIKWDDVVTVSKNAADMGGSQIYIAEGEKISVEDLMKGISMASGNDATVAMAEYISGSESKFVQDMNKKVKELGLKNTQFKNCTGLDEDGHYSSAYDMAVIAKELVTKHSEILRFSSVYEDYLREDTENEFWLVNTNKLVRFYEGADGLKTGFTDNAGYCLAATAERNGLRLIGIVLGEANGSVRNNEMMELLDYGFNSLKVTTLKKKGEIIKKIKLDKADSEIVDIVLMNDLNIVQKVDEELGDYNYQIKINKIKLPIEVGDVIGKIEVYDKKAKIKEESLTVSKDIRLLSFGKLLINELVDLISGDF